MVNDQRLLRREFLAIQLQKRPGPSVPFRFTSLGFMGALTVAKRLVRHELSSVYRLLPVVWRRRLYHLRVIFSLSLSLSRSLCFAPLFFSRTSCRSLVRKFKPFSSQHVEYFRRVTRLDQIVKRFVKIGGGGFFWKFS